MKLIPDAAYGSSMTGYGPGWLAVNGQKYESSLVVPAQGAVSPWSCHDFAQLSATDFEALLSYQPELVLFGSGNQLRFPGAACLKALYAARVGVETMDTPAACRTFNFLAAEGRKVVAALLL